jgi:hypothetical protein
LSLCPSHREEKLRLQKVKVAVIENDGARTVSLAVCLLHPASLQRRKAGCQRFSRWGRRVLRTQQRRRKGDAEDSAEGVVF